MLIQMAGHAVSLFLTLLLLAVPWQAKADTLEFGAVSLDFPGEWDFVELSDVCIAVSKKDGSQILLRAAQRPSSTESASEKELLERGDQALEFLFSTPQRHTNSFVIVPDSTADLGNGVMYREVVFGLTNSAEKNPLAFFLLRSDKLWIFAMPARLEDATPENLNRIRDVLKRAQWRR